MSFVQSNTNVLSCLIHKYSLRFTTVVNVSCFIQEDKWENHNNLNLIIPGFSYIATDKAPPGSTGFRCVHCVHCTPQLHCTLHTAHYTLHTAHCTLHTAHWILTTAHYTLLMAHCTLHSAHCPLNAELVHCTLQSIYFYCTRHTTYYKLHNAHCMLHIAYSFSSSVLLNS